MRIHAPRTPEPDIDPDTVIDIERGAVTFDPWPFAEGTVRTTSAYLAAWDSSVQSKDHLPFGLMKDDDNTLAHTKAGTPVVAKEATWLDLLAYR